MLAAVSCGPRIFDFSGSQIEANEARGSVLGQRLRGTIAIIRRGQMVEVEWNQESLYL